MYSQSSRGLRKNGCKAEGEDKDVAREIRFDLQMEKVISADAIFDDTTRACKVDHYDTEEDYIYLEVMENPLTTILLDAKYRCYISTGTELLCCSVL